MRMVRITTALTVAALAFPAAVAAQDGGSAPGDAPGVAAEAGDDVQSARDRLHLLLLRPDVRRTARDRGIDLGPLHEGIETLGPEGLSTVAPYANEVEAMAAEQAVTISTTTIILGLLLIILLVLIV